MIYQFGPFQLDTTRRRLWRDDTLLSLTPKAFDTLAILVSRPGQVVEKEDLLKAVWPDTFVEDATLAQNISTIRRVLGDTAETPAFIATVPRRGYRFVEAVRELPSAAAETAPASSPWSNHTGRGAVRERVWIVVAAASLAIVAAALVVRGVRSPAPVQPSIAFSISPPDGTTFSTSGSLLSVSPDGRAIAFIATTHEGVDALWLRSLDTPSARAVAGTEGASQPFWSADSRFVAFFADGRLKRAAITSGEVQTICNVPAGAQPLAGTWNNRGDILFSSLRHGILRVSAAGGTPAPAVPHDAIGHEAWPQFLPDGRHFLYEVAAARADRSGIYVGALDTTDATRLVAAASSAAYAPPGALLFVENGQLIAQPFDADRLRMSGAPRIVADGVAFNAGSRRASFSISQTGVLAYRTVSRLQLAWFDREGNAVGSAGSPAGYLQFRIAPDGRTVLAARLDPQVGTSDVWILGPEAGVERRLTFDAGWDRDPLWSPDGTRILFASDRGTRWQMFEKRSDGAGPDRVVVAVDRNVWPEDWSATRGVLFNEWDREPATKGDFWLLGNAADAKPARLPDLNAGVHHGRISPDGRWIAYESYEHGTAVYVRPLEAGEPRWQVSAAGGSEPRWRADGRELFYLAPDLSVMAVEIVPGSTFRAQPRRLFPTHAVAPSGANGEQAYDVTSDGQRFLIKTTAGAAPITVVVNALADPRAR